jgi:hypothetical protein
MLKGVIRSGIIVTIFVALLQVTSAEGDEFYFIDAHSQVDHKVVPLQTVISLMKQGGVSHTILSARGKLKGKPLQAFASQYPEHITLAVRSKGKPYDTGSPKYYKTLKAQVVSGKYTAIAEVLLYHAKKGSKAPEYVVYPEDKRVLYALEYAIDNHWPFVVHIEFASLYGKKKRFMESLEWMLDQYPEHPFVLTHMGQLKPDACQRLIESHKNIYFHTGWTNPSAVKSSNQPWVNLFKGQRLAPEWRELFIKYPERFVFALDNVFAEHWSSFYVEQMEYWKKALAELPPKVAHLIAHGNAEHLWHIAPR